MATFNFKVRATDNLGAFADRDFSINVRNSEVVRFIFTNNQGHAFTSSDGLNWTPRLNLFNPSYIWGDVIWAGSFWLMTKSLSTYLRSVDGINWTEHSTPEGWVFNSQSINHVCLNPRWAYGNNHAAIVLWNSASQVALGKTSDGINWDISPVLISTTTVTFRSKFFKAFHADGKWFVNDNVGSSITQIAQTISDDFTGNWVSVQRPSTPAVNQMGLRYINGLYFIPTYNNQYLVSQDGVNWNAYNSPTGISNHYSTSCILYGNGRLISYPDRTSTTTNPPSWNTVYVSNDTQNWQSVTVPALSILNPSTTASYTSFVNDGSGAYLGKISGTFYGGVYLFGSRAPSAAGFGGLIRSTDGINWIRVQINQIGSSNGTNVNSLASMGQNT